ncbi:hypothetical protein HPSA50_1673 [Helicobacter pylori SouthAfrica50]|uniref:Uncharacterized protein n=1 Tax=Helicobacter pylori SouthAfrica50 TaxID=1352357 RepID=T2S9Q1_HELPX|nr:hypothetical protein HPSA50_1673 [Helicobacter pylori SouthAfrica50]
MDISYRAVGIKIENLEYLSNQYFKRKIYKNKCSEKFIF